MKTFLSSVLIFFGFSIMAQPILIHDYPQEPNDMLPTETGDSIWIATDGGIELLRNFGKTTHIFHTGFEAYKITRTNNSIWFGGKDSIARYDGSQWTFYKGSGLPTSFMVNDIKAVNGVIWVLADNQLFRMLGNGFIDMNREGSEIFPHPSANRFVLTPKRRFDDVVEFVNGTWNTLPSHFNFTSRLSMITYIGQTIWAMDFGRTRIFKLNRITEEWENIPNSSSTVIIRGIANIQGSLYGFGRNHFWELNNITGVPLDSFSVTYNHLDIFNNEMLRTAGNRVIVSTDNMEIFEVLLDKAKHENKELNLNSFEWPVDPTGSIGKNTFFFDDVKIDDKPAIFTITPWITGRILNSDFANAPKHGQNVRKFFSGPISDVHDRDYIEKYNKVWKVSRDQIEQHKDNYSDDNYVMPEDIATWPGNGDHNKGEAFQLAPFVDVNGNGIYEPEEGDYPDILGHQAVYTISNNIRQDIYAGGSYDHRSRKMEVHLMMYAYDSIEVPELDKTVFLNYRVFNRGNHTWEDAKFTLFTDWGMQDLQSSVCGSDSIDNLFFGYNISNYDPYYGSSPVAVVGSLLNQPLEGHIYSFASAFMGGIPMSTPNSLNAVIDFVDFFRNSPISFVRTTTGGPNSNDNGLGRPPSPWDTSASQASYPTTWAFNSPDNWYFPPAEKGNIRSMAVTQIGDVQPGEHRCLEFAFTHGYDETDVSGDWQQALARARSTMNTAKSVYDNLNTGCLGAVLSNDVFEDKRISYNLFPNPVASGQTVYIETGDRVEHVTLISTNGSQIHVEIKRASNGYEVNLPENLAAGAYILNIRTARKGLVMEKLLVK